MGKKDATNGSTNSGSWINWKILLQVPYLELQTEEPKSRRKKRSASTDCSEEDGPESCCRRKLIVDFEAFKWDFIIAPKKYDAYYCVGECTFLSNQRNPHTYLAQMTPGNITPCCGARKMASINMLYFNTNGNIIYGVLPGMVVERCGCQWKFYLKTLLGNQARQIRKTDNPVENWLKICEVCTSAEMSHTVLYLRNILRSLLRGFNSRFYMRIRVG